MVEAGKVRLGVERLDVDPFQRVPGRLSGSRPFNSAAASSLPIGPQVRHCLSPLAARRRPRGGGFLHGGSLSRSRAGIRGDFDRVPRPSGAGAGRPLRDRVGLSTRTRAVAKDHTAAAVAADAASRVDRRPRAPCRAKGLASAVRSDVRVTSRRASRHRKRARFAFGDRLPISCSMEFLMIRTVLVATVMLGALSVTATGRRRAT